MYTQALKILSILILGATLICYKTIAQTGINTENPDENSVLDIVSSSKGILIPRLSDSQVTTLESKSPAKGMLVFNNDKNCLQIFNSTSFECTDTTLDSWQDNAADSRLEVAFKSDGSTTRTPGTEVVIEDGGNVGIGTTTPKKKLHINGATQLSGELNVGGNATTAGSAGTSNQVLTSNGADAAPEWKSLGSISGTVAATKYIAGDGTATIPSGNTKDVPGVTYTHIVPDGASHTLLFTIVGYAINSKGSATTESQGTFSLIQGTSKISSAYASTVSGTSLSNLPSPATLLRAVTLSPGEYTFKVQFSTWNGSCTVNNNPNSNTGQNVKYLGATTADTEAMLTKMQVLIYNN